MSPLPVYSQLEKAREGRRERPVSVGEQECSGVFSKDTNDANPIGSGPTLKTSFNINYFPVPNPATLGLRALIY